MDSELASLPCLACGYDRFDVLRTPKEVEEERSWLQAFHEARIESCDSLKDHADFTQSTPVFVVRCTKCGTVMRNPQPSPHALRRIYRSDTYGQRTLQSLFDSEQQFFREKASSIRLKPGARVLEVGSFVGAFLSAARERNWDATGVDVGDETTAFAREKGLKVVKGEVTDVEGSYDAVFVWNTFDQTNQPRKMLAAIRDLLKADGMLTIRVNNGEFESFTAGCRDPRGRLAQAYNNFLAYPYLVGYTHDSLTRLVESCGFQVEEIKGDTLLPLASSETKEGAVAEEQHAKRFVMRYCSVRNDRFLFPWFDLHARVKGA